MYDCRTWQEPFLKFAGSPISMWIRFRNIRPVWHDIVVELDEVTLMKRWWWKALAPHRVSYLWGAAQ